MRLIFNLVRWLVGLVLLPALNLASTLRRRFDRGAPRWLLLQLDGRLTDLPARRRRRFARWFPHERSFSLLELDEVLRAAARDQTLSGVVCRLRDLEGGWATLWELRRALERFKESGKKVIFYFDRAENRGFWLASVADEVLAAPQGTLGLLGLRAEVTFFRRLFDQVGVTPDFLRVGQYKSFAESFTEAEMTPAQSESLSAVIDDMSTLLVRGIASGRKLSDEKVRALIDEGPFTADSAKAAGLIDDTLYPDELKDRLEVDGRKARWLSFEGYARRLARRRWWGAPLRPRPRIAVVQVQGNIVDQQGGGMPSFSAGIDARTYTRLLGELKEDPRVAGVVLRVNSPGGSALASDLIWRAVRQLQAEKPVVVSMGDVAASGGYYLAAPAGRILATPGTLTGSIGIVAGKFSLGALYERLGIHKVAIERGRHAGMHTESRPFSDTERARLQQEIDIFYQGFVDKVREGRGLEQEAAASAAQGRVWSGPQGMKLGLVDEMGGLREALTGLQEQLELPSGVETIAIGPASAPIWGRLLAMAPLPAGLRSLIQGLGNWASLAGSSSGAMAVMPFELEIR